MIKMVAARCGKPVYHHALGRILVRGAAVPRRTKVHFDVRSVEFDRDEPKADVVLMSDTKDGSFIGPTFDSSRIGAKLLVCVGAIKGARSYMEETVAITWHCG